MENGCGWMAGLRDLLLHPQTRLIAASSSTGALESY